MTNNLLERIIAEQAELEAAGNPAKVLCISREQLAKICDGVDLPMPIAGLSQFLNMEVQIVPEFTLVDQGGQHHTQ